MSDIDQLTEKERDELARRALKASEQSRNRSREYRERKKKRGMTQVSVWVPSDKKDQMKAAFEKHVAKVMSAAKTERDS